MVVTAPFTELTDMIATFDGQPVNKTLEDFVADDPTNREIVNGGTDYYPDLEVTGSWTTPPEINSGMTNELLGGAHGSTPRPRPH